MDSQYRTSVHYFTAKVKDSWVFKIIAEGISKSFGVALAVRLITGIVTEFLLLQNLYVQIHAGKFYAKGYTILKINIPQAIISNKTKISATMSQIIGQYQTMGHGKLKIIISAIKALLFPSAIVKFKTKIVAEPIVGQYIRLAQIDPVALVDIDSDTLEQVETVIW